MPPGQQKHRRNLGLGVLHERSEFITDSTPGNAKVKRTASSSGHFLSWHTLTKDNDTLMDREGEGTLMGTDKGPFLDNETHSLGSLGHQFQSVVTEKWEAK